MVVSNTVPFPSAAPVPAIDAVETRWVAGELADLLRRVAPDSPAGHVLRHARRELESLARSVEAEVVGPVRVKLKAKAA